MRIKPCHGCPFREGCELRDEFRARARGVGASSITFRCGRLADLLRPGSRVVITAPVIGTTYGYDEKEHEVCVDRLQVKATVTKLDGQGRFACVVDPGQLIDEEGEPVADKYRFRKLAPVSRIKRLLDEPAFPICEGGNVVRDDKCDTRESGDCWCPRSQQGEKFARMIAGGLA